MEVEWDPDKARANRVKHGVDFASAETALCDPLALTVTQDRFGEDRDFTIGMDLDGHLLIVVHAVRGDRIRIISARLATAYERRRYEET